MCGIQFKMRSAELALSQVTHSRQNGKGSHVRAHANYSQYNTGYIHYYYYYYIQHNPITITLSMYDIYNIYKVLL